jgi:hypothetical protein
MVTDRFTSIFGTRRGANHSYWCERQDLSRAELLSARLGVPTYRVRSTTRLPKEIEAATVTEAARALLQTEWRIANPADDHVLEVVLVFSAAQPAQRYAIDALLERNET